jgi:gamma-glutamylcyclotransferase (GGCT)/AIG2-like uncharacterized protein YtfP
LITDFFVYGTLKTGQVREGMWPRQPLRVENAWTVGQLFDLGDYPALIDGSELISGQLWSFAEEHLEQVIKVLDEIEVTNQPNEENLYDRVIAEVYLVGDRRRSAHCYYYARPSDLVGLEPIPATSEWQGRLCCSWPLGTG